MLAQVRDSAYYNDDMCAVHAYIGVCVCCVCVFPSVAEAKGVGQKCDRSAANRCGMWKVRFCLITSLLILVNRI